MHRDDRKLVVQQSCRLDDEVERHHERRRGNQPAHHDAHEGQLLALEVDPGEGVAGHAGEHDVHRHHRGGDDGAVEHGLGDLPRLLADHAPISTANFVASRNNAEEDVAVVVERGPLREPLRRHGEQRRVRDDAAKRGQDEWSGAEKKDDERGNQDQHLPAHGYCSLTVSSPGSARRMSAIKPRVIRATITPSAAP